MRLSLKDVFVLIAFCAGCLGCAARVGFDNGVFWFVAIVMAIFSAVFVWLAKKSTIRWLPPLLAFLFFGFFFLLAPMIASLALLVDGLLLVIVGIFFAFRSTPSVRTLCYVVMCCALVALGIGVWPGISAEAELNSLQKEFPIVSLQNRLQYEKQARPRGASSPPARQLAHFRGTKRVRGTSRLVVSHSRNRTKKASRSSIRTVRPIGRFWSRAHDATYNVWNSPAAAARHSI